MQSIELAYSSLAETLYPKSPPVTPFIKVLGVEMGGMVKIQRERRFK
jgi:hypothetical protein